LLSKLSLPWQALLLPPVSKVHSRVLEHYKS
jgi:hypothetical protein